MGTSHERDGCRYLGGGLWEAEDGTILRAVDGELVHVATQGCRCAECLARNQSQPRARRRADITTRLLTPEEVRRRMDESRRRSPAATRGRPT